MQPLSLARPGGDPLNVLCLGAHCDDIEIGCGGTLLSILAAQAQVNVVWRVFCSSADRAEEAREGATRICAAAASLEIDILDFRDGFLPYEGAAVKGCFESKKGSFEPDIVFTHHRDDRHQDHRVVSDLTWNTYRNHLVLEYEIPKWDGDLGSPNFFVPLAQEIATAKIETILSIYASQRDKAWFEEDLFRSLMRIRGMECNAESRLAEAFYVRKAGLAFPS